MKKRILSLTLSMVLLLISAVPGFAIDGVPEQDRDIVTSTAVEFSNLPGHIHSLTTTPLEHSSDDLQVSYYSLYHSGNYDQELYFQANEGDVTWTANGNFAPTYRTNFWTLGSSHGIAYQVSNDADEIYMEISTAHPKGEYVVYYGCHHSFVDYDVMYNGQYEVQGYITRAPYMGDTYLCVDY